MGSYERIQAAIRSQNQERVIDMSKETQSDRIIQYIKDFGSITGREAVNDLGCMHLASRISDMRKAGIPISDKMISVKNRYGETCFVKQYWIDSGSEPRTPAEIGFSPAGC